MEELLSASLLIYHVVARFEAGWTECSGRMVSETVPLGDRVAQIVRDNVDHVD